MRWLAVSRSIARLTANWFVPAYLDEVYVRSRRGRRRCSFRRCAVPHCPCPTASNSPVSSPTLWSAILCHVRSSKRCNASRDAFSGNATTRSIYLSMRRAVDCQRPRDRMVQGAHGIRSACPWVPQRVTADPRRATMRDHINAMVETRVVSALCARLYPGLEESAPLVRSRAWNGPSLHDHNRGCVRRCDPSFPLSLMSMDRHACRRFHAATTPISTHSSARGLAKPPAARWS